MLALVVVSLVALVLAYKMAPEPRDLVYDESTSMNDVQDNLPITTSMDNKLRYVHFI